MTELKNKIQAKASKAKQAVRVSIYQAFDGILIIWALSVITYFAWAIIKPEYIAQADAGFWSFVTLMITSLFVIIHSRFKK